MMKRAFMFLLLCALSSAACLLGLTAEDKAKIAIDGIRIGVCQTKARSCLDDVGEAKAAEKCWPIYDECMTGAGLRDGGAE